ncbi:MAG TPA: hypothetical protein VHV78_09670, partial [Gemmatimonadaceae bacterium]|nr:hypothetical protein [Gemmatimonadaceae bacterium]
MLARGEVRGDRHLADVEFEPAHHPAERFHQDRDLDEFERERARLNGAGFEGGVVSLQAGDGSEREVGHGRSIAMEKVTIPALQQMKRDGRKIVGV